MARLVDSTAAVMNSWITMANEAGIPLEALAGHHGVPAEQTLKKCNWRPRRSRDSKMDYAA